MSSMQTLRKTPLATRTTARTTETAATTERHMLRTPELNKFKVSTEMVPSAFTGAPSMGLLWIPAQLLAPEAAQAQAVRGKTWKIRNKLWISRWESTRDHLALVKQQTIYLQGAWRSTSTGKPEGLKAVIISMLEVLYHRRSKFGDIKSQNSSKWAPKRKFLKHFNRQQKQKNMKTI